MTSSPNRPGLPPCRIQRRWRLRERPGLASYNDSHPTFTERRHSNCTSLRRTPAGAPPPSFFSLGSSDQRLLPDDVNQKLTDGALTQNE